MLAQGVNEIKAIIKGRSFQFGRISELTGHLCAQFSENGLMLTIYHRGLIAVIMSKNSILELNSNES